MTSELITNQTFGFIGFGLIGGSIAKILRQNHKDIQLIAYNYYGDKPNPSLELALSDGVLNHISTDLENDFKNCDVVFLCAPVLSNIDYLKKLKGIIKSDCILTDVGSVKGNIYEAVAELGLEQHFIGGHPMAGSEQTGYESANLRLFENAYYVLTPTNKIPEEAVTFMKKLVTELTAIPVILDCKEHDDMVAAISHVPHIIAASLVNMVRTSDDEKGSMISLAAGGFKDITRIASSSPVMWQNICLTNKESIKKFLDLYKTSIDEIYSYIDGGIEDKLYHYFEDAKDYRDSIPLKTSGIIGKVYELYLDIIDEAGAIASIATLLASNGISIKNIGIVHNREFEDGILRIEFYEEEAVEKAIGLFERHHYTIYKR